MAHRIAKSTLNASTIDILNVIRQNASLEYQDSVPVIDKATDIPKVGQIIYGTPALANQFINALVNRIALVVVRSATFNNPYAELKKGYLDFGETVEEVFIELAKVETYDPEKGVSRELKRTVPDVMSAFHVINWRVMYPITIEDNQLKTAFLSNDGIENMIAKIVKSIYTAAAYDEFLLFKYLIIKGVTSGKFYPISIGDGTDLNEAAEQFRATSNKFNFVSTLYNERHVHTAVPIENQYTFMDCDFSAKFDVNTLAYAFNIGKADALTKIKLIDDFTTFDNERWATIRAESTGLEEVTSAELALMVNAKGILVDKEWFQVYDNLDKFTEKYVASGLYWNYFYHQWKTISTSPFSNAVVFVSSGATITNPTSLTFTVAEKEVSSEATILTLQPSGTTASLQPSTYSFDQIQTAITNGIAIDDYGAVTFPVDKLSTSLTLTLTLGGVTYTAATPITGSTAQGASITFNAPGDD